MECVRPLPSKKVYIAPWACTATTASNALFEAFLTANGYEKTLDPRQADLLLCATCGSVQGSEDVSVGRIRKLQALKKPGAELVVTGCLPQINPERLNTVFSGPTVGARSFEALYRFVRNPATRLEDIPRGFSLRRHPQMADLRDMYGIVTSVGCLGKCSFCVIPKAVGKLRSRPIPRIVEEFREGLAKGHRDFILLGDDNGTYGFDLGTDMASLLEEILALPQDFRLVVWNFNPWGFVKTMDRFKRLAASPKLYRLHVPVQHAHPRLLKLMIRPYAPEWVRDRLLELRALNPALRLYTAFIVGYPSETEEEFQTCVEMTRQVLFDDADVYRFSMRPGLHVPAGLTPVPLPEMESRRQKLVAEVKMASAVHRVRMGRARQKQRP